MSKKFLMLEKTVSVFTIIIGFLFLTLIIALPGVSLFSVELHNLKIISILAISGGVLLFFQKKAGWILSSSVLLSIFIYYGINFLLFPYLNQNIEALYLIYFAIIFLIILSSGILLLTRPFTTKYTANLSSFLIIAVIISYFIADRIISYEPAPQMEEIAINCEDKANILQAIYDSDQGMRKDGAIIPNIDRRNLSTVISLIEKCGMPSLDDVDEIQMTAVWLVFQHGDNESRKKYLPLLKSAAKKGDLSRVQIAMMEDRILMNDGLPQLYGSQIENKSGEYALYTLQEPERVNIRRAEMGFGPLEDYVARWGISFDIPQVD